MGKYTWVVGREFLKSKSFLKWAGGKSKLMSEITRIMSDEKPHGLEWNVKSGQNYFEPFMGSATVFLGFKGAGLIHPNSDVYLSDINDLLVLTMQTLQDSEGLSLVIDELKQMVLNFDSIGETYYYTIRDEMNRELVSNNYENRIKSAARMIFINKTCFNGLWRVNRAGAFNVPLGRSSGSGKRRILQEDLLRSFSFATEGVNISQSIWSNSFTLANRGDLIYVDPPYLPIKDGQYVFTDYSKEGFSFEDHKELASQCIDAASRGVRVIVSNNSSKHLVDNLFSKKKCFEKGVQIKTYQIDMKRTMKTVIGTERDIIQECVIFLSKKDKKEGHFALSDIQHDEVICKEYLQQLPANTSFANVINHAHKICPELQEYCDINSHLFNGLKSNDKGSVGKMVEFFLFGQLPDTESKPDLGWADIKTTHFESVWGDGLNAKERLTITNCGNTDDYSSFGNILSSKTLQDSKFYPKIRRGLLFVFEYTSGKYNDYEKNMQKRLLCAFIYDVDQLPGQLRGQLDFDFTDIQMKIKTQTVSQKGQEFLHIHPHGSKGSSTRALGFKNKFVTILVAHFTNKPLTEKGKSLYIEKRYF